MSATAVTSLLRLATGADADAMLAIRNSTDVRAISRRQYALDADEFKRDLLAAIEDDSAEVFILDRQGQTAGYVRIEPTCDRFEIGIALASEWRSQGLGAVAIREATGRFRDGHPGAGVVALIRPENVASIRAFTSAGYHQAGDEGDFYVYEATP